MIVLHEKPLSMGRIWSQTRNGRRFLTKEGQDYKKRWGDAALEKFPEFYGIEKPLEVIVDFHGPWLAGSGKVSKTAGDLDNFLKLSIDGVCQALKIDDCFVVKITARKVLSESWKIEFSLHEESTFLERYQTSSLD
jgi:Holliday junction resolvase RusA-like endonuclease